jgi:hypothetical protein
MSTRVRPMLSTLPSKLMQDSVTLAGSCNSSSDSTAQRSAEKYSGGAGGVCLGGAVALQANPTTQMRWHANGGCRRVESAHRKATAVLLR